MFFLLPPGKYSRILESRETQEDNSSPYLVQQSFKQTNREKEVSWSPGLLVSLYSSIPVSWSPGLLVS